MNASEAKRAADGITTRGMERIWVTAYSDFLPKVTPAKWTVKERKLLKSLIESYGKELVDKSLVYLCRRWGALSKKWKIESGVPTIGILWGYRAPLFADIQTGGKYTKKRHMDDDFGIVPSTDKGLPSGWG